VNNLVAFAANICLIDLEFCTLCGHLAAVSTSTCG
jgi:hypothetical protein